MKPMKAADDEIMKKSCLFITGCYFILSILRFFSMVVLGFPSARALTDRSNAAVDAGQADLWREAQGTQLLQ